MSSALDEIKTATMNSIRRYASSEQRAHFLSGWEQGFDFVISLQDKFHEWLDTDDWAVFPDIKELTYKELFNYYIEKIYKK